MSTTGTPFKKPEPDDVTNWYSWLSKRKLGSNPFHPTNVEQYWGKDKNNVEIWKKENAGDSRIWLAAVIATTVPANKPSQISNVNAIVSGSEATAVYSTGDGDPTQKLPAVTPRNITIDKGDTRDLYCPIDTELATAIKYPKLTGSLDELAQKIIDREDVDGIPPASVEFEDAERNKYTLSGNELKSGFRIRGTIDKLDFAPDNVAMLPAGSGAAAFSDLAVILDNKALKPGINTLRFGVNGKFFGYTLEFKIQKM
jgi:hypothetical protein